MQLSCTLGAPIDDAHGRLCTNTWFCKPKLWAISGFFNPAKASAVLEKSFGWP